MKVKLVEFVRPVALPGGRQERVISMDNAAHVKQFAVDIATSGFVRIVLLDGKTPGDVIMVGPTNVNLAIVSAEAAQAAAKK